MTELEKADAEFMDASVMSLFIVRMKPGTCPPEIRDRALDRLHKTAKVWLALSKAQEKKK